MAGDTVITVIGNLVADPELRYSKNGAAVANFTVASTPRNFDKQSGDWKEGETLFMRCSLWREAAENVAESLRKGMRVIVQGRLKSRSWEAKDGSKRTNLELDVDEVGPSLRYATANVQRTQRGGQQQGGQYQNSQGQTVEQMQANAANQNRSTDPWAGQANGNYDWGQQGDDSAPF